MIKEWLLVAWLGTSSNFVLLGVYWDLGSCAQARSQIAAEGHVGLVVVCTQDMREGRSAYPPRGGDTGLVK